MVSAGHSLEELPFQALGGVYGSWFGFTIIVLVLIAQFYIALWPVGGMVRGSSLCLALPQPKLTGLALQADNPRDVAYNFFLSYLAFPVLLVRPLCFLAVPYGSLTVRLRLVLLRHRLRLEAQDSSQRSRDRPRHWSVSLGLACFPASLPLTGSCVARHSKSWLTVEDMRAYQSVILTMGVFSMTWLISMSVFQRRACHRPSLCPRLPRALHLLVRHNIFSIETWRDLLYSPVFSFTRSISL